MKTTFHITGLAAQTTIVALLLAGVIGGGLPAAAASPSELLEKGIYSEETKGDLDAALQCYAQVIAENKGAQAVAAQAQYRLGVCYYKKKNYAEASAAFEKLIRDYPDQKEFIAMANKYLAGAAALLPAPWADGEELKLDIKFPTGFKLGAAAYAARSAQTNGQKIWRLSSHLFAGVEQASRVEVEADSFKPIRCRWKHTLIGEADTIYAPGRAELKLAGKDEVRKIDLEGVVYDNEEAIQLMRRLPLAADYKRNLRIFAALGGGNILNLKIEVTGQEKVEVPAGTFDCYKVEMSLVRQTFWYSTDAHHYLVKFEGGGVVGELSEINLRKADEPVQYRDPAFNFSLRAPADWLVHRADPQEEKGTARVMIFDPDAMSTTIVNVGSLSKLKPEVCKDVRTWADYEIAEGAKTLKELQIRPESWKERPVGGKPGLSVIGDFVEGKEKKVGQAIFTLDNSKGVVFVLLVRAQDLESFQPKFESIVDSYKGE